jgi:chromate reductase, NAD(P)H dehydrogenase (quinone)
VPHFIRRKDTDVILICAASNGNNLKNAQQISAEAKKRGIAHEVLDLVDLEWPLYSPNEKERGIPKNYASTQDVFALASGYLCCAPEYNGSIPPVLSNTIAWLSVVSDDFRALFNSKPVALSTHSGGAGQKVLLAMRVQFSHLGCNVIGRDLVSTSEKPLRDEAIQAVLEQLTKLHQ